MCTTADPARPTVWPSKPGSAASLQQDDGTAPGPTGTRTQLAVFFAVPTRQNTLRWNSPSCLGKKLDRSPVNSPSVNARHFTKFETLKKTQQNMTRQYVRGSLTSVSQCFLNQNLAHQCLNTWTVCWRNINQQLADLAAAAAAAAAEGETKQDDAERESRRRGVFRSVSHLSSLLSSFEAILMSILISM